MGCICSKGVSANEYILKQPNKSPTPLFEETHDGDKKHEVYEKSDLQLAQRPNQIVIDQGNVTINQCGMNIIFSIKNGVQQNAGGCPTWLNVVAGDAIKDCLSLTPDSINKMYKFYLQGDYLPSVSTINPGKIVECVSSSTLSRYRDQFLSYGRDMETEFHFPLMNENHATRIKLLITLVFMKNVVLIELYVWDSDMLEHRNIYSCSISLKDTDSVWQCQTLFRLFKSMDSSGYNKKGVFLLNFLIEDVSRHESQKKILAFSTIGSFAASMSNFLLKISQTSWHSIKAKLISASDTGYLPELKPFLGPDFEFSSEYTREEVQLLLVLPICITVNGKYKMLHIQDICSNTFLKPYNEKGLESVMRKQILARFEEKTPSEQEAILVYLFMNWQDLQHDSSFLEALKETKFVTSADGDLYKPKDLFDLDDTLLISVFSGEVHKFPGERFVSDEWLNILRKTGLRNTGDPNIMLECARRVEFLGSESMKHVGIVDDNKPDFSYTNTEVSYEIWSLAETLIKAITKKSAFLNDNNFCNLFGKIACIPAENGFPFEPEKKCVKKVLCSYSEAVLLKDWPLAWRVAPILSSKSVVPPEYSWGALQLRSPPPFNIVIKHLQVNHWRKESCLHINIEEAFYEVLKYLDTIWSNLSSSDVSKLSRLAFIPVANATYLANCGYIFSSLTINLAPFAFELPLRYQPFVKILKQLGLHEMLSISSAMAILSSIQNSCGHHPLNPNELRAVIEILHFLCNETIERKTSDRSSWESNLVVPNDACRLVHPNSCVYIDSYGSHYVKHIDSSIFCFVHHDVSERLCLSFGITKLSDIVVEEPDRLEPLQTLKEIGSVSLAAIRVKLKSRPFQVAVSRVVNKFSRITPGSKNPDFSTLQRSLESVAERLQFVRCIYTRFWLIPRCLDITRASKESIIPEWESGSSGHRTLYYVDRSNTRMLIAEPPSYVSVVDLVAIVVSHVLGSPLVPLPIGSLFFCPRDSETALINILRHSSDEREMDGVGSGIGFLGSDLHLHDSMQVKLKPQRPFYKGEIVAWQGHNGEKLKYGRIPEDVRPSAAQLLYRFKIQISPEKTTTIISSRVFVFSTHMMREDDGIYDGSAGRGRLGVQEFVQAIEEMLSGAGIRIDTEKQSLIQITLSLKERLKESQAALVLQQEKSEMVTQEADKAEAALLCGVCLTKGIDITAVPCGHVLCYQCSSAVSRCPFCRVQLSTTMKLCRS